MEDVGEPLASRGVASSPGRKEGGVEWFLRDADACKKFHHSIFIAVPLVVAVALRQASVICVLNLGDRSAALVVSSLPDITPYFFERHTMMLASCTSLSSFVPSMTGVNATRASLMD